MRSTGFPAVIVAVAVAACGGNGSPDSGHPPTAPTPPPTAPVSVSLCCGSAILVLPGSRQIEARATYGDGSIVDVTRQVTSWESSNPSVATISSTGLVEGVTEGAVELRGTYAGITARWLWTVLGPVIKPPAPNEITGHVREFNGSRDIDIARARLEISGGVHHGRVTEATYEGLFRIGGLTQAGFDLVISKRGYRPLRVPVRNLGTDLSPFTVMETDSSTVSDVLKGGVCWPTRTITTTFTPQVDGIFRYTSLRGSSNNLELYSGGRRIARFAVFEEAELQDGVTYELRATGNCDYNIATDATITYLRPR